MKIITIELLVDVVVVIACLIAVLFHNNGHILLGYVAWMMQKKQYCMQIFATVPTNKDYFKWRHYNWDNAVKCAPNTIAVKW